MKKYLIILFICFSLSCQGKDYSKLKFSLGFASANLVTAISLNVVNKYKPNYYINSASNIFAGLSATSFVFITIKY